MNTTDAVRNSTYRCCMVHDSRTPGPRTTFKKDKASFSLAAPGPHLLLDCDKSPVDQSKPHCDYILFVDGVSEVKASAVPIEMTHGEKKIRDAVSQLQAGAETVTDILPESHEVHFTPVFVGKFHERRVTEFRKNPRYQVRFRKKLHPLLQVSNGARLDKEPHFQELWRRPVQRPT